MTDVLAIIGDGDEIPDGPRPQGLSDKALLRIFSWLVLLRTFDERAVVLQKQGRIGTYPMFWGEEATQAGPLFACDESDWLWPSYRQSAIGILRGLPASTPLLYRRGIGGAHGFWNPRTYRVAPICIPIGTHLPHAVGLAWAARMRGESLASLVWFGDGATSEGDFHEAMNFAAVFKAPVIFFCVNNQWAISTPVSRQTATETIAEKAVAYGIPAVRVDGFDPLACWTATRQALDRARTGGGPFLIEAYCYRLAPHGTADDPSRYRDEAEARRWRAMEPVGRTAAYLRRLGVLDDEKEEAARLEATEIMARAVEAMEAVERPGPAILFEPVYGSAMPWTLSEGLSSSRSVLPSSG